METSGVSLSVMVPVPVTGAALAGVDADKVMASVGSPSVSLTVGTRTMKLVAPAGTETVGPSTATKVTPLSNDTRAGLVSVPSVAEPDAGVSVTVVGVVLEFVSVTVKSRLLPSATVGLETEPTRGLSLSVPPGPVPSSVMVPTPSASAMTAPAETLDSVTLKASLPSKTASFTTFSVIVCVTTPGAKVRVPARALMPTATSAGTLAVPEALA